MHGALEIPSRKRKGPSCPQTEERLPTNPFASSYAGRCLCFPVKRRSQARSSWERREVLAAKSAVFPLSHPKCFPATGRTTGLVPPAGRSRGTTAGLQHPSRDLCPASFLSFQAMIWHRQVPAVSPKPGFKTLPQTAFLSLRNEVGTAQWAARLSPSTKCTTDPLR